MPFDQFGEEYRVEVDTAHTAGGAWGVATFVELGGAPSVDRSPGVVSAEFPDRAKANIGHRRSKKRNPQFELEIFMLPGDAAFDRVTSAEDDVLNAGLEILRLKITEGDPLEAGNRFWEADWVITEAGAPSSGFGEGSTKSITLRHSADSPNAPVTGVTT